jgi:amidase
MWASATAAVKALRAGEVAASELVGEQLARLRALDDLTHAVAWWDDELALDDARRLDEHRASGGPLGALHGVPITVKDWIDVAGFPCAGEHRHRERRPEADATVVARLRAAGAVVIAKTAPWGPEPPTPGWVRHPDAPDRSPGGSSTGEAVAVAGGGSLLGIGSDSGGSIRLPASWCGAVGFKPTAGLVPTTGHFPRVGARHDGRTQIGPLARTVDDAALVLSVVAGPDGRDGGVPPVGLDPCPTLVSADVRFAVITGDEAITADDDAVAATEWAADALEGFGMRRTTWTAPWLGASLDLTRRYWARRRQTGAEVDRQLYDWDTFRYRYLRAAEEVDVLVTPTTPTAAPLAGPVDGDQFAYTLPASLTGSPAIAVPCGRNADGLPLSVQLVGRPWEDHRLLAVGAALSAAIA